MIRLQRHLQQPLQRLLPTTTSVATTVLNVFATAHVVDIVVPSYSYPFYHRRYPYFISTATFPNDQIGFIRSKTLKTETRMIQRFFFGHSSKRKSCVSSPTTTPTALCAKRSTTASKSTTIISNHHRRITTKTTTPTTYKIAIIGGGPAGIYAAIHAAAHTKQQQQHEHSLSSSSSKLQLSIIVYEATSQVLRKVKISGGGRCNVIHDTTLSSDLYIQKGYPRGNKELRSICYQTYTPQHVYEYFTKTLQVPLKTEVDGRMFPTTDDSQTIIDALLNAITTYTNTAATSISIQYRTKVIQIIPPLSLSSESQQSQAKHQFQVITATSSSSSSSSTTTIDHDGHDNVPSASTTRNGATDTTSKNTVTTTTTFFDAVIIATGSAPAGYALVSPQQKQQQQVLSSSKGNDTTTTSETPQNDHDPNNCNINTKSSSSSSIVHPFVSTVPSLFTFNCKHAVTERKSTSIIGGDTTTTHGILYNLAGVSVPKVRVSFTPVPTASATTATSSTTKKKKMKVPSYLTQEGPILITHHGLSGPAILRL